MVKAEAKTVKTSGICQQLYRIAEREWFMILTGGRGKGIMDIQKGVQND